MTKTQTISRENLSILYNESCNGWRERINEVLYEQPFNSNIVVDEQELYKAYKEANSGLKKLIESFFHIETPKKITDQIKTITDVYNKLGIKRDDVIPYKFPQTKLEKHINADFDINKISEVLNQGWTPDFNNSNQYKYYPYFKKGPSGWVVHCAYSYDSYASLGLGFYFSSSELALYAGNQFLDVYNDWLP